MNNLTKYEIPIAGLKQGKHIFYYEINDTFLASFEDHELSNLNFEVQLELIKEHGHFVMNFTYSGSILVSCDRCLEMFDSQIHNIHQVIVKHKDINEFENDDDLNDIVYITSEQLTLNIADLLYEFTMLSIPMKNVHPDTEDQQSGCVIANMNDGLETKEAEEIDPRWAALKNIKF